MKHLFPDFPQEPTRKQKLEALEKHLAELRRTMTPEIARQNLFNAGLIDEDGNPSAWLSDPDNFNMPFFVD